jgi:PadR family transcriptional regulator, regulatory protein AphA
MAPAQKKSSPERERRTDYVVLAVLRHGPATGYGIRKRITTTVGNFWQESFGQLYPSLRDLVERKLVRTRAVSSGERGGQLFSITAQGTSALRDWVRRPPRVEPERNELLLKLFLAELDSAAVVRHLSAARDEAQLQSARLRQMLDELTRDLAGAPSLPAWCATVDYGIAAQSALTDWCNRTIERLQHRPAPNQAGTRCGSDRQPRTRRTKAHSAPAKRKSSPLR